MQQNITQIRLFSGLVLAFLLSLHLIGHMGGILSLDAMEFLGEAFEEINESAISSWVFLTALIVHFYCACEAIFRKYSFRSLTKYQILQFICGFFIPLFLIAHITIMIMSKREFEIRINYDLYFIELWKNTGEQIAISTMLILISLHVSLGLWSYFQSTLWFGRFKNQILIVLVLFPLIAFLGVISGGERAAEKIEYQQSWVQEIHKERGFHPDWEQTREEWYKIAVFSYLSFILFILALRFVFSLAGGKKMITVSYPNGDRIKLKTGGNLLDASNLAHIPHAQLCQGQGRCSTCRVYVSQGSEHLEPMGEQEREVLKRFKSNASIRLACQAKPTENCQVDLLISPEIASVQAIGKRQKFVSEEREVVIFFSDIRGFTKFSEHKLPYDVVFILNRYFNVVGKVIEQNGGYLDKFIGDGTMAIFGMTGDIEQAAKGAINAAKQMEDVLIALNKELTSELAEPLKVGLGIHAGRAIIGEMGYKTALSQTAIGDTVNTASRLEAMTKEAKSFLICSDTLIQHAQVDTKGLKSGQVEIRGKTDMLKVWYFATAEDIPANLPET